VTLENCNTNLALDSAQNLTITPKKAGTYNFRVLKNYSDYFEITVYEGTKWGPEKNFIAEGSTIRSVANSGTKNLFLRDVEIATNSNKKSCLKFKVSSEKLKTATVSVFCTNFRSEAYSKKPFNSNPSGAPKNQTFKLKTRTNAYKSEAGVSDEVKYVYDRRDKRRQMGNTLEKPTMLLQRQHNKETVESLERLKGEFDYANNMESRDRMMKCGRGNRRMDEEECHEEECDEMSEA
jgi:hypothetical protein